MRSLELLGGLFVAIAIAVGVYRVLLRLFPEQDKPKGKKKNG